MGFKVTEVAATPNPAAKKFTVDRPICETPRSYFNAGMVGDDPLAAALFGIDGVAGVLILRDFVTVTKAADAAWPAVTAKVKAVLKAAG